MGVNFIVQLLFGKEADLVGAFQRFVKNGREDERFNLKVWIDEESLDYSKKIAEDREFAEELIQSANRNNLGCILGINYWHLTLLPISDYGENRIILFSGPSTSSFSESERMQLAQFVEACTQQLSPAYAFASHDIPSTFFNFCADPCRFVSAAPEEWPDSESPPSEWGNLQAALQHPAAMAEVGEARKLIPMSELLQLAKENALEAFETNGGFGVWKYKPYGISEGKARLMEIMPELFPTYFIRRELRKRGAKLYYGPTEERLLWIMTFLPQRLEEAKIIGAQTASKLSELEKANRNLPRNEQEVKVLEILTREEKHELGLDLPHYEKKNVRPRPFAGKALEKTRRMGDESSRE